MRAYRRNPIAFMVKERRQLWRNIYGLCATYDSVDVQRMLRMPTRHFKGLYDAKTRAMGGRATRELDAADEDAIAMCKKMINKQQEQDT